MSTNAETVGSHEIGLGLPPIADYPIPSGSQVPSSTARWVVEERRVALLVHDMQNYFVRPFGTATTETLVGNIERLIERFRSWGAPVAYTAQPGRMTTEQRGLLADIWGPGMNSSEADRQILERLRPTDDDWRLTKWRYSAFHRSDLAERMSSAGRDQLVLCGVYGHVGVLMTAVESFTRDIETFVVADAIGDFSRAHHDLTLNYAATNCAVVCSTADLTP